MELFFNIIHYFIYRACYKFYLFSNKINPLVFPFKSPNGEDPFKELTESYKRTDFGICITVAGGIMCILVFFILFGASIFFSALVTGTYLQLAHFFGAMFLSITINHFFLFKKGKYLIYFNKIKKMNNKKKQKWAWISFSIVLGILFFISGSFLALGYQLRNI